jgi:hypothetical protein
MRYTCRILVFSIIFTISFAITAFSQTFENTSTLLVSGGISVPTGDLGDVYGEGPFGRITYRLPTPVSFHIGIETGINGPSSNVEDLELLQIPLRILAVFPFVEESASTPFFAVGGGATINKSENKGNEEPDSSTDVYMTYTVQLGYTLRPESMESTLFEIYIRYEQQLINDSSDFRNLDVGLGIGLCF